MQKIVDQAEIHRKVFSVYAETRRELASQLRDNFVVLPDKEQAWNDPHRRTEDEYQNVRLHAANAIRAAFPHIPDKEQAREDLHRLTEDVDRGVRSRVIYALGYAFPNVPDKIQSGEDLHRLTKEEGGDVRVSANHSLGRASIFKATEAESEKEFRKEIENALTFFERSSKEVSHFNPSKFCLPFYIGRFTQ